MVRINIWLFLSLLWLVEINAQNNIDISVISATNNDPIENIFIYNYATSQFVYSDQKGKATLGYKKITDSVFLSIPGYQKAKFTVNEIQKKNNSILLFPKFESLDAVLISTEVVKQTCKYTIDFKKKHYVSMISSGGSMVSYHEQKKCGTCNLNGIIFFFDNKIIDQKTYIRPVIFELKNDENINLLETPYSILLHSGNDKLIINLSNTGIILKENHKYMIGFEMIDRENKKRKVYIR